MSPRSDLHHTTPRTLSRLLLLIPLLSLLLATGCGLTGSNQLADDAGPEAVIDVLVDDNPTGELADNDVPGGEAASAETASDAAVQQIAATTAQTNLVSPATDPLGLRDPAGTPEENHVTRRGLFRTPDEATIDMPPISLGPVRPVSSRTNLLKGAPLIEGPPIPELDEQGQEFANTTLAPEPPPPVAATQLAPTTPRTIDKVDTENFQQEVLESDIPVMVDFYADTCGPCKLLAPMLDQVAREQDGLRIVKVNIDHDKKLAQRYRVRSVPTIMIFSEGKMVVRQTGLQTIKKSLGR